MSYIYDHSPSGDTLRVSRCDDGHLTLVVTSFSGKTLVPVCIAPEDVAEVIAEMQAWADPRTSGALPHPEPTTQREAAGR